MYEILKEFGVAKDGVVDDEGCYTIGMGRE